MAQTSGSFVLCKWRKRKNSARYMRKKFKWLKVDKKEIIKEQQSVKQVQRQVAANLRATQEECDKLRNETDQIIRQTAHTRARLALMFNILKAREQGDLAQAAQLTQSLRETLSGDNSNNETTVVTSDITIM
ncbi:uncharacterized protein LOC120219312 [Hibiscus syriacus]|uniref:uncharacterized protein LOC120219312 n=1 Tax=Hibiscus syriacus TaxID=106335 RepID=UPI001924EB1A|nr:uncharacterized protein LOC120219312 [Hibiscus syriacus]